jgi:hypothetical protein
MFREAKSLLARCGFSDCKWIRAKMPKQGVGTNDCGVWMCCLASIYAKCIFSRAVLPSSQPQETVVPFRNVTMSLVNGMIGKESGLAGREKDFREQLFGLAGREHLTQSLIDLSIDMDSDFFAIANISFSN